MRYARLVPLLLLSTGVAFALSPPKVGPGATSPVVAAPTAPEAAAPVTPAPVPTAPVTARRMAVQRWTQTDGTQVLLVEDHRIPEVQLRVEVPVGEHSDWFVKAHAEEAWTFQNLDPENVLRGRTNALAADVGFYSGATTSGVTVVVLKQDLEAAVVLLGDIFLNRSYNADELKRAGQGESIGWKAGLKVPGERMSQAIGRLLYADADPRRRATEKPTEIERNSERLAATRDEMLRLPGRRIGVAGDISRAEAEAVAARLLPAPTSTTPDGFALAYLALNTRPTTAVETLPKLTQVYFSLVRDGIVLSDPDYPAFRIANHVLGGHFFSRLMVALRHEGGETYGAGTRGGAWTQPGPYSLTVFTRVENRSSTETKLREVLATFRGGITETERAEAVGFLEGSQVFNEQAPASVLGAAMADLSRGLPVGFDRASMETAARLPLDEINTFIKRFYDPGVFTLVTVEPPP
ncbi:MAG: insulinase family protein [Myxococcales bacterium]|nr:insulinase family protein [Myxococcales bacterium]